MKNDITKLSYHQHEILTRLNTATLLASFSGVLYSTYGCDLNKMAVFFSLTLVNALSLRKLWSIRQNTKEIENLKKLYEIFLNDYTKFMKDLRISTPMGIYAFFTKMLYNGFLSNGKWFSADKNNVYDIEGMFSLDVINGHGVCRHLARMLNEIYLASNISSNTLTVYFQNKNINDEKVNELVLKAKEDAITYSRFYYDEISKYENEINDKYCENINFNLIKNIIGNHLITTVTYDGVSYYLDPTNDIIFKNSITDPNYLVDFRGIKYCKISRLYNKDNLKTLTSKCSTFEDDVFAMNIIEKFFYKNIGLMENFYNEHQELYSDISNELSKIKKL